MTTTLTKVVTRKTTLQINGKSVYVALTPNNNVEVWVERSRESVIISILELLRFGKSAAGADISIPARKK